MSEQGTGFGSDVRQRLSSLLNRDRMLEGKGPGVRPEARVSRPAGLPHSVERRPMDALITYNEVSLHHGTGILLRNLLGGKDDLVSIRAQNTYGGEQDVGVMRYSLNGQTPPRDEIYRVAAEWTHHWQPRNILCVPYSEAELLTAIALKDTHAARLCLYVMDDQNVVGSHIADAVMAEAVEKADLRLAISTEMMMAYQEKWNKKFHVFPPHVRAALVAAGELADRGQAGKAILIGNIWSHEWLARLSEAVRGSGIRVDWFTNNPNAPWLHMKIEELRADGIDVREPLPEDELASLLPGYSFAIVPTGTLGPEDTSRSIAALSLPSRVPFLLATSQLPLLVVGNRETAVSQFVEREGVGVTVPYERQEFRRGVERMTDAAQRGKMRARAAAVGPRFSDEGAAAWLWETLLLGHAADRRYDWLEQIPPGKPVHYMEDPVEAPIWHGFHVDYRCVRRMMRHGIVPDFVVDIGASTGVWSHSMSSLLPDAKFYLVEPLLSAYPKDAIAAHVDGHPNFQLIEAAVADKPGEARFTVSRDLYNSSLIQLAVYAEESRKVDVRIVTLDQMDEEMGFRGRGFLKIDVQFGEHLVFAGGRRLIEEKVDAILVELTLARVSPEVMTLGEWIQLMDRTGFEYFDDGGEWRDPASGRLQQKDLLFVRKDRLRTGGAA